MRAAAGRERRNPVFQHIALYPRAIPQYNVGYGKFKALMNDIEAKAPGLFFAGHYRDGVSLGDSIVSGVQHRRTRWKTFSMSKGVLLVNLGSPDSTSVSDVRRYLNEFLMDGRVIDAPWLLRRFIVGMILINRPKESAHAYEKIWTPEGSPLVVTSRHVQTEACKRASACRWNWRCATRIRPSKARWTSCGDAEVDDLLLIPLFPHYAMSSYETAVVRVQEVAAKIAPQMKITVQPPYYDAPDYIAALVASAEDYLAGRLRPFAVQLSRHPGAAHAQIRPDGLPLPGQAGLLRSAPARRTPPVTARNVSKPSRLSWHRPGCRRTNIPCRSNRDSARTRG